MSKPKLTQFDFEMAAAALSVEISAVLAVDAIESRGKGFYPNDRPIILFERHHFKRYTGGKYDLTHPDISGKSGNYSGDQYRKFDRAEKLDRMAALKSTSWGRFQILGINHKLAGFENIEDFISAMERSEKDQLVAFVNFLKNTGLDKALRRLDFKEFAKGYNGKLYAKNKYDVKLREAYEKFIARKGKMI